MSGPDTVEVMTEAIGRADFGHLELVLNGQVIERAACVLDSGRFRASLKARPRVAHSSWLAVRVSSGGRGEDGNLVVPSTTPRRGSSSNVNEMGETLFAHSSPVYLDVAGTTRFDDETAEELIAEMETAQMIVDEKGQFATPEQRHVMLNRYETAIERLRQRQERAAASRGD